MKRVISTLAVGALVMAFCALAATPAMAAFGFEEFDVTFTNPDGTAATQAGSHPYEMKTTLSVNTTVDGDLEIPDGETKGLEIHLPEGFVGDPLATPRCTAADFIDVDQELSLPACPDGSAIGIAAIKAEFTPFKVGESDFFYFPVYNLAPPPGVAAKFGFIVLGVPVSVETGVNGSPPYNLVASVPDISQALVFYGSELTLWGNPADPVHDPYRGSCITVKPGELVSNGKCSANVPNRPFLTLPRSCSGPLTTTLRADSWEDPGIFIEEQAQTHDNATPPNPLGITGCGKLGFDPAISAAPTTRSAESPTGLDFSLDIEDEGLGSPTGLAQSDIKKVVATLPEGVTVNPSAAEGLGVCTRAGYESERLGAGPGEGCPQASKIGSVRIETPLLENEAMEGSLYQAQQDDPATTTPGAENPFDSLLALYVVIENRQRGIFVKQAGKVEPDLRTGQLISTFEGIPQLPFSHFELHFREGPRSPLVTPSTCGTYTTKAELTPWAGGAPRTATSTFEINSGVGGGPCPSGGVPPFRPGFEAGSINNNAASYSPFAMRLTRQDGEQSMTRFDSILPPGVTGKIAGVARCADAAIAGAKAKSGREELAAPSCPASSRIGHVLAGAGVGPALTYVPGQIYLAGPYNGAPLSVVVITPAVAGPFDAGTVVTREALALDPNTAEVQVDGAASDPIPHILKGIPLKLRDLRVFVDRPDFILNPTSCDPMSTRATLFGSFADVFSSADDVPVSLDSRYQAANCSRLGFKPKLSLRLRGGTKRGAHPALRAVLTERPGDANVGKAVVTLPHSAFLEQAHIRTICTRVQFAANKCPKGSIYGKAAAYTPLLDEPLRGPVYLRSSSNPLPDMVVALHGTIDFNLVGRIDSVNAQIRSSFESPPDAPVSKFVLEMQGGRKGLIVNSTNLCAGRKKKAKAQFTGHNGKTHDFTPILTSSCAKKAKK